MNYQEKFEDEGFIYELKVQRSRTQTDLYALSQPKGFSCRWTIVGKDNRIKNQVVVTDDDCQVIIYQTIEAAVSGARDFLCLS